MTIRVFNTLTHAKEDFKTLEPGKVLMYACGPTVYDDGHIGHARAAVTFDVITRYLRFRNYEVIYVRNYTDVDDKIINRANDEGLDWTEIAETYTLRYEDDLAHFSLDEPTHKPKVSDHIPEIIEMVKALEGKGAAYESGGSVYFSVDKFSGYGKLSGRSQEELETVARIDHDPNKQAELDFALWKAAKPGEPQWDSPWGPGRPGWHIECSAMSTKYLGQTFDIHGGGRDLIFPHHENEIAQSEAANEKPMVKYWIHNGHVTKDGVKISKSLGNFIPIKDLIQMYDPEALKVFLFNAHYHSPLDFTEQNIRDAEVTLERFYSALARIAEALAKSGNSAEPLSEGPLAEIVAGMEAKFIEVMDDDFNTARVLAVFHEAVTAINHHLGDRKFLKKPGALALLDKAGQELRRLAGVLGFLARDPVEYIRTRQEELLSRLPISKEQIDEKVTERSEARKNKDFASADALRDELAEYGVVLEDQPEGTTWRIESK